VGYFVQQYLTVALGCLCGQSIQQRRQHVIREMIQELAHRVVPLLARRPCGFLKQ
jgi:oligoribonuclease (3'-5' exoribonuclease)